jgi:hypothetical protein
MCDSPYQIAHYHTFGSKLGALCLIWQLAGFHCKQKAKQSKAVPLHAMVALGGRGGIAPTHS